MNKNNLLLLSLLLFLSGCVRHNVPSSQTPNKVINANTAVAFVDQDGTFYPDNWGDKFHSEPRFGGYSLRSHAKEKSTAEATIMETRNAFLSDVKRFISDKDRVFILVHGFNSGEKDIQKAYGAIRQKIAFAPKDGIIEFYWDGLVADSAAGGLKIWFNAAGYSQLAGTKALRAILNQASNKDIVFIAHSRGASVVLSSLGDPPYDEEFVKDTKNFIGIDVFDNEPLSQQGNKIFAVFLAPAIGEIDFGTTSYNSDGSYRVLDPQVATILHTVNESDRTLKKYIGLHGRFNPTDLGYKQATADAVKARYSPKIEYVDFSGMNSHRFIQYVENPEFLNMLKKIGVQCAP